MEYVLNSLIRQQLIYFVVPLVLPVFLPAIGVRFAIQLRSSQKRVAKLEAHESISRRLATVLAQSEKVVEDAAMTLADDPRISAQSLTGLKPGNRCPLTNARAKRDHEHHAEVEDKRKPRFTPGQRKMIASLNTLPNLTKYAAYLFDVSNTHGVIVGREDKKKSEGVLRHWAQSFIL